MDTTTSEEKDIGYGPTHPVDVRGTPTGTVENLIIGTMKTVHKCTEVVNGTTFGVTQDFHMFVSSVPGLRRSVKVQQAR